MLYLPAKLKKKRTPRQKKKELERRVVRFRNEKWAVPDVVDHVFIACLTSQAQQRRIEIATTE